MARAQLCLPGAAHARGRRGCVGSRVAPEGADLVRFSAQFLGRSDDDVGWAWSKMAH